MLKKIGQILNQRYTNTLPDKKAYKSTHNKEFVSKRPAEQGNFIELLLNWDQVAGEKLREVTLPQRIKNKTLTIVVSHPLYAQHLKLIEQDLIKKIEGIYPRFKNNIKELKFYYSEAAFIESEEKVKQTLKYTKAKKVEYKFNKNDPKLEGKIAKANEIFSDIDDEFKEVMLSLYLQS